MKLTNTTTHEIKFSVECFEETEGGMNHDAFGDPVETLPEAIHLLEVANEKAKRASSKYGWTPYVIVCHVKTASKG